MPIYEYQCRNCGHQLEVIQQMNEPPLSECSACQQAALEKKVSAAGFQLKGSGWYVTDFKGDGSKIAPKEAQQGISQGTSQETSQETSKKAPSSEPTTRSETKKD